MTMLLATALLLASMTATAADAMRIHPAMQMREEGEGAYAADNDDAEDGFVSGGAPRSRTFLLVRPPQQPSASSDDRLLRQLGGDTEGEEGSFFSRLMHNIDEATANSKHRDRQQRPQQPRLLLAPPEVEIAEPWQTSHSAKSIPRKRSNGNGLNLSILNNMDVLRNKLLRELMARNQARNTWSSLSERNQAILDDIG